MRTKGTVNEELIKELALANKTKWEIAEECGLHESTVRKTAKKLGLSLVTKIAKPNDPALIKAIEDLCNKGRTNKEIANTLNISPTTARKYTKSLGKETNSIKAKSLKTIELTDEQLEIIYGSMLGDLCLTKTKKKARFIIHQGGNHELYFDHLCEIFKPLLGRVNKRLRYDLRTKKSYNAFSVKFLAHSLYLRFYDFFYKNGVKTVTQEWVNKLTEKSIAYWFMDDGSKRGIFATNSFSYNEIQLLQRMFYEKYNITSTIKTQYNNNNKQFLLQINNKDLRKFEDLIRPYMHQSMMYKLLYQ